MPHREYHSLERLGWLRAAVLGANDGIISTASLLMGVAAANTAFAGIVVAGFAGLMAGAMSMAAGEYVSVCSQLDMERAALSREAKELEEDPAGETKELTHIYIKRGLSKELANEVAKQLMKKNALAAHARDELGITEILKARPLQAAIFSGVSFTLGALLPILSIFIFPKAHLITYLSISTLLFLLLLGSFAAKVGKANLLRPALRVMIWGALAMAASAGIGALFRY